MTRPALFAILLLTASPCAAPEPVKHRQVYEAPPELMTVIKALLDASRMYGVDPMLRQVGWLASSGHLSLCSDYTENDPKYFPGTKPVYELKEPKP